MRIFSIKHRRFRSGQDHTSEMMERLSRSLGCSSFTNRRIRNRTSGGVGGRGPRGPLLPDPHIYWTAGSKPAITFDLIFISASPVKQAFLSEDNKRQIIGFDVSARCLLIRKSDNGWPKLTSKRKY